MMSRKRCPCILPLRPAHARAPTAAVMGSAWHKKSATAGREWVTYAAAGVVLLVIAGVVTGVVVAKSGGGGDSQPAATADAAGSTTATPQLPPPVVVSSPPAVPAPVAVPSPSPAPVPLPASPTPAPVPAVPAPVVAPTPVPVPVPASPVPAAPASPSPPTNNAPTTYDPSYVTKSTVGNTRTAAGAWGWVGCAGRRAGWGRACARRCDVPTQPPACRPIPTPTGFDLPVVEAGKAGTCEVHTKRLWICNGARTVRPRARGWLALGTGLPGIPGSPWGLAPACLPPCEAPTEPPHPAPPLQTAWTAPPTRRPLSC